MTDKNIQTKGDELIEKFERVSDNDKSKFISQITYYEAVIYSILLVEEIIKSHTWAKKINYWNQVLLYLKQKV